MNFLKRFFGSDGKFYDLLEASADEANHSAKILGTMIPSLGDQKAVSEALDLLGNSRRKHKRISQDVTTQLCRTFITPLEREDIEQLSNSLSRVPKTMEKIGERLLICPLGEHAESLAKQAAMLEKATDIVAVMVRSLRGKPHVEDIEDEYGQLQALEGDADRFMIALLRELFDGRAEAKDVVYLKDMYELMEKAIDRCRDAGKVVFQVVLKYS